MDIERFNRIQTPEELRKLSPDLLKYFSDELRKEIIHTLSMDCYFLCIDSLVPVACMRASYSSSFLSF